MEVDYPPPPVKPRSEKTPRAEEQDTSSHSDQGSSGKGRQGPPRKTPKPGQIAIARDSLQRFKQARKEGHFSSPASKASTTKPVRDDSLGLVDPPKARAGAAGDQREQRSATQLR